MFQLHDSSRGNCFERSVRQDGIGCRERMFLLRMQYHLGQRGRSSLFVLVVGEKTSKWKIWRKKNAKKKYGSFNQIQIASADTDRVG